MKYEVRQGSRELPAAICGIPGGEFEPRCPLRVTEKSVLLPCVSFSGANLLR